MRTSAAVLAGGRSRRLGLPKATLRLGGRTLLERTLELLQDLFEEVLVVTSSRRDLPPLPIPVLEDLVPGQGPLGGLHAALRRCRFGWCFVVACDMPCLRPEPIRYLCSLSREGYQAVVPRVAQGWEPLHALYSKECLPEVERGLREERPSLQDLLGRLRVRAVEPRELIPLDPELRFLWNLNSWEDYRRLASRAGRSTPPRA